ncbi:PREDICTED: receptor-type tyrosine-protein phosphatase-like N isoform X1 [Acromyrmex echinatior]|uniref:receptor-type tyrosine-protein phosphatase-like N isoform X1 n=1 Tax=Acromyrmex echinatior TaxID=103372 RepID=UPI000580ECD1|nr:PREDICTED: receptor-type tyrosine-protein phosphatase-like N isoform X1 [Acromyrmex echinatior]
MGRKRWQGGLELLVLCILVLHHVVVLADGDVGCLFSEDICDSQTEKCFDDLAFGKCIPQYTNLENENLYQYNLDIDELELLHSMRLQLMRLIESNGYNWKHPFTQCIVQTSLHNLRYGQNDARDFRLCEYLKKPRLNEQQDGFIDEMVPAVAILRISTDNENPESNLADVLYRPTDIEDRSGYMKWRGDENNQASINNEKYDNEYRNSMNMREQFYPSRTRRFSFIDDYQNDVTESLEDTLRDETLPEDDEEDENVSDTQLLSANLEFLQNEKSPDYTLLKPSSETNERAFSRKYKHRKKPLRFEFSDTDVKKGVMGRDEDLDYGNSEINEENSANIERSDVDTSSKIREMYTEGGVVRPRKYKITSDASGTLYDEIYDDDLDALLWRRELAGFKRRERLDVKKPGPPFSTNNYAFKTQSPATLLDKDYSEVDNQNNNNEIYAPLTKKELHSNMYRTSDDRSETYKNVDLDYVYIEFEQEFHTWLEGEHVVNKVEELLGLPSGTLKDIRVGRAEVTFKVIQNDKNYNATEVVNNIDNIRGKLQNALGIEVIRAGIGDKTKLPATLEVARESDTSSSFFGALVAAGVAAAVAAAVVTLIIARRHAKCRAKLAGLATPDPEASKDYQDLCRARMQAKQPSEKLESPRITSLTRENESNNLSSNRSSTSSWGEEPALTNMDISTGHMVLRYMEDHLKNKDRLDQEWGALCAYEAEPSSTEIAESEANVKQNRPNAALPYDHSRVVLNDLANANNSDYINASTIKSTDHDPRNPAYIATQGPLPQTTADFWQLVWEQGSVVIVMLTRLTEEGRAMCHRYWPEEGSELYHIYEVHLVSEHFWCDDYLVRSFYLKNLRTCETRTVTQFHFLSWPENSVPYSTKALLEFRRKVNKSYRGRSCPIVVHCSDGAGRTGTYCLIDMVLNRMTKGAKEIDIAATLEHIRDQRPDMVATKQQFEFVLMAVAEEVHAILKALPVSSNEKSVTATGSSPPTKSEQ